MGGVADLNDLTGRFLVPFIKKDRENFKIVKDAQRLTREGKKYELDFLIIDQELDEEIGVSCKEWNRGVAVNVVNSFINKIKKLGLSFGIMIAEEFSGPARVREENCDNLVLITKEQMKEWLRSQEG